MAKNIAVYGIYANREMVERAVDQLKAEGFRSEDISVLLPEGGGTKEFAVEKETKAPEGAVTGAGAGVIIGGALGWLTGIGLLTIPGIGPFLAAGPIVSALAGIGAIGVVGGIAGALIGMGIPEYEAQRYEGRVKEGGILLSVHADDDRWKSKARHLLEHTGAEDISDRKEEEADYDVGDRPYPKGAHPHYKETAGPGEVRRDEEVRRREEEVQRREEEARREETRERHVAQEPARSEPDDTVEPVAVEPVGPGVVEPIEPVKKPERSEDPNAKK
ncbi:MAG: quinol:electron acceptor oxidoreductase subunit ActD [Syntrophorhabdus sp.]